MVDDDDELDEELQLALALSREEALAMTLTPSQQSPVSPPAAEQPVTPAAGVQELEVAIDVPQAVSEPGPSAPPSERALPPWVQELWSGVTKVANDLLSGSSGTVARQSSGIDPEELCPICYAEQVTFAPACGHAMCLSCAVHYLRDALGDKAQVLPQGVKCPMHAAGCEHFITSTEALQLVSKRDAKFMAQQGEANPLSFREMAEENTAPHQHAGLFRRHLPAPLTSALRSWAPNWYNAAEQRAAELAGKVGIQLNPLDGPTGSSLSVGEVKRLHIFEVEAAIPQDKKAWCPRCKLVHMMPDPPPPPSRSRRWLIWLRLARPHRTRSDLECAYCHHRWDPRAAAGDASYDEMATAFLIRVTSKGCPNPRCEQRISHYHGHACHHISPATNGCPACHQHFCYVCGRPHGTPGGGFVRNRLCTHGSSFCNNRELLANLVMEPYPHDRRCGCPICPNCKPHKPCEQCDGHCVVCQGVVPPGPTALPAHVVDALIREDEEGCGGGCTAACKRCRPKWSCAIM